jgi:hypothetical protein
MSETDFPLFFLKKMQIYYNTSGENQTALFTMKAIDNDRRKIIKPLTFLCYSGNANLVV